LKELWENFDLSCGKNVENLATIFKLNFKDFSGFSETFYRLWKTPKFCSKKYFSNRKKFSF